MKDIKFCNHALAKFEILKEHGFNISLDTIKKAVINPDFTSSGRKGRKIATKNIDESHDIRIIYEENSRYIEIVTFYPTQRGRYESKV